MGEKHDLYIFADVKALRSLIMATILLTACSRGEQPEVVSHSDTLVVPEMAVAIPPAPEEPILVHQVLDHEIYEPWEAIEFMNNSTHAEEYANGIIPLIVEQNIEYAKKLLKNKHRHFVIVDKGSMYVILYDRYGVEVERFKMCCSRKYGTKHAKRDNRTPEGFFSAGLTYDSTDWLYTDDDGNTSKVKGQFGPRFIRVTNPVTTQIGIHGTCAPWSLGRRSSHGCIRIHNDNIMKLIEYVHPGMPIIINPSNKDQEVNREEGYNVVQLALNKKKLKEKLTHESSMMPKDTINNSAPQDSVSEPSTPPLLQQLPQDSIDIRQHSI